MTRPQVFIDVGLTLDGCLAGPRRGPANPMGDGAVAMHQWIFETATFREKLGLPGGHTGPDDERVRAVFARAGAYVMGRNMFDEGEAAWPETPPFGAPVFVLTHRPRAPWVRPGGTTFFFVTDGLASALAQARAAAGAKDVRVSGGADTVRQALAAGWVDELTVHVAPLLLGEGLRLWDGLGGLGGPRVALTLVDTVHSPHVSHLVYRLGAAAA